MIEVTMNEWNILTFIRNYTQCHGRAPSTGAIKCGCGITGDVATIRALASLRQKGLLDYKLTPGGHRHTMRLTDTPVAVTP